MAFRPRPFPPLEVVGQRLGADSGTGLSLVLVPASRRPGETLLRELLEHQDTTEPKKANDLVECRGEVFDVMKREAGENGVETTVI